MTLRLLVLLLLTAGFAVAQDEEKTEDTPTTAEAADPDPGMADRLPRPEDAKAEEPPAGADTEHPRTWEIEGYLTTRFNYENADGDDVARLFVDLNADFHHRGKTPFTVRVNGRAAWTMTDQPDPDSLVYGVWDTFSGNLNGILYELFIAFPKIINKQSRAIIGRQFIDEGIYLQYDGARLDLALPNVAPDLVLSVYGGAGVEWGMPDGEEHWLVGVLGKGTIPKYKTRWRLQYLYVNQYFEGINDPTVGLPEDPVVYPAQTLEDHLVGASVWQPFGDQTRFFGRFTLLNGDANELHLRLRWFTKDGKWTVLGEWYQLFQRLFNVTNDLTPFVPMLGSFDPFFRATIRATWRPRQDLVVELGGAWRVLDDSEDEGVFNHQWFNYYVTFTWLDLWKERMDLTITANGYETDQSTQHVVTSNLDIRLPKKMVISLGLDYALYKYIWFSNSERENVWTYRAEWRWDPKPELRTSLGLFIDDDRVTTWTSFIAKLTWRF
ncbi:MAG: hypothetical protein ACYTHK_09980 [Planctomycetota bacterium]